MSLESRFLRSVIMKTRTKSNRPHTLGFRISDQEKAELARVSAEARLPMTTLARQCFALGMKQFLQSGLVSAPAIPSKK
jgi:hypothetical protein